MLALVFALNAPFPAAAAPSLSLEQRDARAYTGQPFRVEARVSWSGDAGDFLVLPVELEQPERGMVRVVEMDAFSRNGMHTVVQTLEIIADEPGTFELAGLRVGLADGSTFAPPPGQMEALASNLEPAEILTAPPLTVTVREPRGAGWWGGLLGLLAVLVVGLSLYVHFQHRRAGDPMLVRRSDEDHLKVALHEARRLQLDGDHYTFYRRLADAAALLAVKDEEAAELAVKLRQQAQDVGYRGVRPTDDDLNGALRDVERLVNRNNGSKTVREPAA
jgi:hypothetical protein